MGRVFSYNYRSIILRKAVITKTHFINRICGSDFEMNSFIKRYNKYMRRGYTIFVGNINLTRDLFNYLYDNEYNNDLINIVYKFVIIKAVKRYIQSYRKYKKTLEDEKNKSSLTVYSKVDQLTGELEKNMIISHNKKKRKMHSIDDIMVPI